MIRLPPRATRTYPPFPYTTLFRSLGSAQRDPNGPINWPEFGNPNEETGYRALHAMSSYQKIKDGTAYPAVMALHGVQDPRVVVWNSSKRSEEHTSELQSLMSISYAVFCLKKTK